MNQIKKSTYVILTSAAGLAIIGLSLLTPLPSKIVALVKGWKVGEARSFAQSSGQNLSDNITVITGTDSGSMQRNYEISGKTGNSSIYEGPEPQCDVGVTDGPPVSVAE